MEILGRCCRLRVPGLCSYTPALLSLLKLKKFSNVRSSLSVFSLPGVASHTLVMGYAALAWLIEPVVIEAVIVADPDDDVVLACAVAARAEAIVSGDNHLLDLKQYEGIPILTAAQLLAQIKQAQSSDT